ncbi:MAG: mannose-1-phosphate guanylyltransferase/mannose-6-phosphate isomerase, partial [Acidiferrobacterales bacterium]
MLVPVILSGGSGTRLWPMSREYYPKQLLPLTSNRTLLQDTVTRLDGIENVAAPIFVCNEEHRFLIAEQIEELGRKAASIVLEPVGRNTAPALTLAALLLRERGGDPLLVVMPADHDIRDADAFRTGVRRGVAIAARGYLVTFGVVPTAPATGYGYIRVGEPMSQSSVTGPESSGSAVDAFVEKPDLKTARGYLESDEYLWNSGIFMMRASVWLNELKRHRADVLSACESAYRQARQDGAFLHVDKKAFENCPSDSIDYAVMEKTDQAAVIPLKAGWSDVGAWSSLWETSKRDEDGNVLAGDVYAH